MKTTLFALIALLAFSPAGFAHAPLKSPAVEAMKAGDFERATTLFVEEIKANPDEARLKQLYTELKTNIRRETSFAEETNSEMKTKLGKQLRGFYYKLGLFARAETVDQALYAAAPTTANAVSYGVTLLNLDKNKEAAGIFAKTDLKDVKPAAKLCAALAFARVGDAEKSKALCTGLKVAEFSGNELQLFARIAARNGDETAAADAVRRILEQTPAKQHAGLKTVFAGGDFAKVAGSDSFRQALATVSKVEDKCATCPNRGTSKCDGEGHDH